MGSILGSMLDCSLPVSKRKLKRVPFRVIGTSTIAADDFHRKDVLGLRMEPEG